MQFEDLSPLAVLTRDGLNESFHHGVAVLVDPEGNIVCSAHNEREATGDPTAHAELLAIQRAGKNLGSWRLSDLTLVVTLEPCVMCAGALYWSQLDKIVFAARDEKRGAGRFQNELYHPKSIIVNGPMAEECSALLTEFFANK